MAIYVFLFILTTNQHCVNASQILPKPQTKTVQVEHFKFAHTVGAVSEWPRDFYVMRGDVVVKQIDILGE